MSKFNPSLMEPAVKIRTLFFAFILLIMGCSEKLPDKLVWDMPTPYADSVFHTQNIYQFAQDIEQLTNGKLVIRVHPDASLYKHPEIKYAVRNGQVPLGEILMSLLGNEHPIYQIDSLPLLATNYDQARKLWQVSRKDIEELLAKDNLILLFAVPWPPQGLYIKKPISSLEDMRGLKIRVYNAMLSRLVELMGSNPTTVQTPEIQQAFSTGIIDAMITSASTGASSQVWDYVEYYYDIQAWIPKNMVIANKKIFEDLPETLQKTILQAAAQAEERGWAMSEKETIEKTQELIDHGVRVVKPSEAFNDGLLAIRQKMLDEWAHEAGIHGEKILKAFEK